VGCDGVHSIPPIIMSTKTHTPNDYNRDVLGGDYFSEVLPMPDDYEGPVVATLVKRKNSSFTPRAVLYVHGFADYFFKTELADTYLQNGYDFYAVDLRKCGRSLLPHQLPNFCRTVDEYFEDIRQAIEIIRVRDDHEQLAIHGHSTGALIVSLFAHMVNDSDMMDAIVLDSPFFSFNEPWIMKHVIVRLIAALGRVFPYLRIPGGLSKSAGECIHSDFDGEWSYRLDWKPIGGFPLRAGWIRAIHQAHLQIRSGLSISTPVLVMHAAESSKTNRCTSRARKTDTVLNISDIIYYSKNLGNDVTDVSIADAMHDLVLSEQRVRECVYYELFNWLANRNSP